MLTSEFGGIEDVKTPDSCLSWLITLGSGFTSREDFSQMFCCPDIWTPFSLDECECECGPFGLSPQTKSACFLQEQQGGAPSELGFGKAILELFYLLCFHLLLQNQYLFFIIFLFEICKENLLVKGLDDLI